ncbi:MAG: succinylglutamate desuccinylase/aspartoacylase family protein [Gammaproteobacteria bacterium]|nr:succinylglutamate desuccinylase/aspartoacylase family protein [Gammaproteobacteria bacterium]
MTAAAALRRIEGLPPGLLDVEASALKDWLGAPTLLRLKGRERTSILISVLLHGNETSGWDGLRQVLRRHAAALPRDLLILIGNVEAAAAGVRTLPDQADFNRIWRPASGIGAEVLAGIADEPLLAVVDLHNNTGQNPPYAVLTDLSPGSLGLACLYDCGVGVFIEEPDTVLTRAFAGRAPSIALELGPVADAQAIPRAVRYLDMLFALGEMPTGRMDDLRLFRTLARVHPPADAAFGFLDAGKGDLDLVLDAGMEASNFRALPAGAEFGAARNGFNLQVLDNQHQDVTDRFLEVRNGRILAAEPLIPAMYTTDENVIRQDCLCYLMAPI